MSQITLIVQDWDYSLVAVHEIRAAGGTGTTYIVTNLLSHAPYLMCLDLADLPKNGRLRTCFVKYA